MGSVRRRLDVIALIVLALLIVATFLVAASAADAAYEGVSVKHARAHVRQAARRVREANAALSEARRVLTATRRYSSCDYTSFAGRYVEPKNVGRWVWLASNVGWPVSTWPTLFGVIARESSGDPGVPNAGGSGALGLLQEMPDFYLWYGLPYYDRANPRANLHAGLVAWRRDQWAPWLLTAGGR